MPEMLSGASEPLKKRLGWFAYAISAVWYWAAGLCG